MFRSPAPLALLLTPLLLAAPACDDAPDVGPEDMGVVLAASPRSVCPDVGQGGTGEVFLQATVYARDGSIVEGATVFFETDSNLGTVDPEKGETNSRGLVRSTLSTEKTDLITVTALVEGVGRDHADIQAPAPGRVSGFPTAPDQTSLDQTVEVGELFDMFMVLADACHAKKIYFEMSYDPLYVRYDSFVEAPLWIDPELVDVEVNGGGTGYLSVTVTVSSTSDVDFTGSAGFLRLRFEGILETPTEPELVLAEFEMPVAQVWDAAGEAYDPGPGDVLAPVQVQPPPDP